MKTINSNQPKKVKMLYEQIKDGQVSSATYQKMQKMHEMKKRKGKGRGKGAGNFQSQPRNVQKHILPR